MELTVRCINAAKHKHKSIICDQINPHLYLVHIKHSMTLYNVQGMGKHAPPRRAEGPRGGCRPHLWQRVAGEREDEAAPLRAREGEARAESSSSSSSNSVWPIILCWILGPSKLERFALPGLLQQQQLSRGTRSQHNLLAALPG